MLESTIERELKIRVKALGGIAIKFIPLAFAGFPDRIVLLPGARIYFVELKAPGKTPEKIQLSRHRRLKRLGFAVLVIDSLRGVHDAFTR